MKIVLGPPAVFVMLVVYNNRLRISLPSNCVLNTMLIKRERCILQDGKLINDFSRLGTHVN